MRILILSQWFDPEPFFKGMIFIEELRSHGHEVEVLTGFPNYPGGKVYPGYSIRLFSREDMKGIRVNRVALFPSHNESGFLRILNYLSFLFFGSLIGPFVINRPDIIYVYNLPSVGFIANVIRFFYHSRIVLDIQDLWPESVSRSGMLNLKPAQKVIEWFSNKIYRSADHITVLSPGFKKELTSRGIPERKISVVYNWCSESFNGWQRDVNKKMKFLEEFENKFNVVFAGTMGKMQALESIIEAALLIEKTNKNVQFWLIGGGIEVDNLKLLAHQRGASNIRFVSRLSESEMGEVFTRSDVLLVHLKNDPLFEITIPSKIQAYMFSGKPILVAVKGDAAQLVLEADAGISCEPENPTSIANAVNQFSQLEKSAREHKGNNGKEYYWKYLSLKVGAKRFSEIFNLLGQHSVGETNI
jgi:glycosyltransferase involved in cell wall biosynthesis